MAEKSDSSVTIFLDRSGVGLTGGASRMTYKTSEISLSAVMNWKNAGLWWRGQVDILKIASHLWRRSRCDWNFHFSVPNGCDAAAALRGIRSRRRIGKWKRTHSVVWNANRNGLILRGLAFLKGKFTYFHLGSQNDVSRSSTRKPAKVLRFSIPDYFPPRSGRAQAMSGGGL